MDGGGSFVVPARLYMGGLLRRGRGVVIDVGCVFEGDVALADDVQIGPYCVLRNVKLVAGTIVNAHSVLEGCDAGADCVIGPFARVRPTTQLAAGAHIGNFVEVKNATLGESTKANHLAYAGDAKIGARTNISAGLIPCNYNVAQHQPPPPGHQVLTSS